MIDGTLHRSIAKIDGTLPSIDVMRMMSLIVNNMFDGVFLLAFTVND
jgi:hypothetical protein